MVDKVPEWDERSLEALKLVFAKAQGVPRRASDLTYLKPEQRAVLTCRPSTAIEYALRSRINLDGAVAAEAPEWDERSLEALKLVFAKGEGVPRRASDLTYLKPEQRALLTGRTRAQIEVAIQVLQGKKRGYKTRQVDKEYEPVVLGMAEHQLRCLLDPPTAEKHKVRSVDNMTEQLDVVTDIFDRLGMPISPHKKVHAIVGLVPTKHKSDCFDQCAQTFMDLTCAALKEMVNKSKASDDIKAELEGRLNARMHGCPSQKFERQAVALQAGLLRQGIPCIVHDYSTPAGTQAHNLDISETSHGCAHYSNLRPKLKDLNVESGKFFLTVLEDFATKANRQVVVHGMYEYSGEKSLRVGMKDVRDNVTVFHIKHISHFPLTERWQAIIVARMLHAAGIGPAPGSEEVPPAQAEALQLGQDYQDEEAAGQDDTASLC